MDMDSDEAYLDQTHVAFMKNITDKTGDNNAAEIDEGSNMRTFRPLESNSKLCNLQLPAGKNFCCGYHESREHNEGYVFVWNSEKNHLIYRINGSSGECQIVKQDPDFNFQLKPEHFIAQTRCVLISTTFFNKITDTEEVRKFLIFTDNFQDQRCVSVEDSIATNGFSAADYPYFATNNPDCRPGDYINLGLAPPMSCVLVEPIQRNMSDPQEAAKPNLLKFRSWQFRIKFIDVYGRESEHGPISDIYVNNTGTSIADAEGFPRCLKLKFGIGCPLIDKIQIEFRNCTGNVRGFSIDNDWFLYDVINKYNDCENKQWWERTINTAYNYNSSENTFEYEFCANKEYTPIPSEQTNRGYNPLPLVSGSVFSLAKNIGLARNKRGFEPLDCEQLDKINFSVTAPDKELNCVPQRLRKITIYALIYTVQRGSVTNLRKSGDLVVFGDDYGSKNNPITFGQYLPKGQEGFIGYLAGTSNFSISKQVAYDPVTREDFYAGANFTHDTSKYFALQKFEFNVLPGKYIFRIANHRATISEDYQKTSTYFIGTTTLSSPGTIQSRMFEFGVIDVCDVDYNMNEANIPMQPVMIWNLMNNSGLFGNAANVLEGYLYEDEINRHPISGAKINASYADGVQNSYVTDYNGHYFVASYKRGLNASLYGVKNCVINTLLATTKTSYDDSDTWYRYETLYVYRGLNKYPVHDRFLVKGKVVLCDNSNIGVPGILVLLTNGKHAITNADGEFTLISHPTGHLGTRSESVIYSQRGDSQVLACGDSCVYCFPEKSVTCPPCNANNTDRVVTVETLMVKVNDFNRRGPQMGGRYGLGVKAHDWLGRHTFIQARPDFYVDIPSLQETGVFDFSKINFSIASDIIFPSWVRYISFYITENLNTSDFLTWVAERVQFVDNTGKVNSTSPTQIRLYYEGLSEYNKQNNYSTNALWQFISDKEALVSGDQVEFLANGDGSLFTEKISELVRYDKDGKYFSINYTDKLKDLKDGALIKLVRPKYQSGIEFYYELCPIIKVVNGVPETLSGTFNFFDSYLLSRQIPVPIYKETTVDGEIVTVAENELRSFPFFFEHHSPSDTWGSHCWNKGRVNVKNPYENQRIIKTEIAMSGAISNNGLINRINYFKDEDIEVFDEQQWGGITGVLPELNYVLIICENDSFVVSYNDSAVHINEDGFAVAPSADNRFSRPQRKIGSNFGCHLKDINTIRKKDGIVMFVDRSNAAIVMHNYSDAVSISEEKCKSWIKSKMKQIIEFNSANPDKEKYFHGIFDPKTNEYLLTDFLISDNDNTDEEFINNERGPAIDKNETMSVSLRQGQNVNFKMVSFTPEYYGTLQGDIKDNQMFSFRRGEAWFHNHLRNPGNTYNTFYGIECDWVIEYISNLDHTKVKKFLWNEVYVKEIKVYIDRILTESGQSSYLMPNWWDRRDKFWVADYKCAVNSVSDKNISKETGENVLLEGDNLVGRWLKARLLPVPVFRNKYFELTAIIVFIFSSEKSST